MKSFRDAIARLKTNVDCNLELMAKPSGTVNARLK